MAERSLFGGSKTS